MAVWIAVQPVRKFWKMNTSILNDAAYIEEVKKKVLIWREEAKEVSDKRVT